MWAHYAESNTGICLGFDVMEDLDFFDPLIKIDYLPECPKISYLETPGEFPVKEVFFTKSIEWKDEKEYRVLKMNNDDNLFAFNKNSLRSITFGIDCEPEEIKAIKEILSRNSYNVNLSKLVKVSGSFKFKIEPL